MRQEQGVRTISLLRCCGIALLLAAVGSAPAQGAVGDLIDTIDVSVLPNPGFPNFCSIGLAFDGTHLYYDRCNDPLIYTVAPPSPGVVGPIYDLCIPENPNCLAYDGTGNGAMWIGTQRGVGAFGFTCGNIGMPIYRWDFGGDKTPGTADDDIGGINPFGVGGCGAVGAPAPVFTIPLGLLSPLDGGPDQDLTGFCFCDGLAFDSTAPLVGGPGHGLWWSDDVNQNVGLFDLTGVLHNAYLATTVDAALAPTSGLAVGGPLLYMGNDGFGQVWRTNKVLDPLPPGAMFAARDERVEDMECDPLTYTTDVIWVRSTPQGNPANDLMTAYEIESGTCGLGGEPPCDPDPRTQGYWHRQCLGLSEGDPECPGIDPGRNGRGPKSPTEPDFCPDLWECGNQGLEDAGMFGDTTCEGMDADPPSDKCEKALKQLTALILNVCADYLQNSCEVDLSAEGCESTNVGDLINEIGQLINDGDCNTAHACAAATNEGDSLVGNGGGILIDLTVEPEPTAPPRPRRYLDVDADDDPLSGDRPRKGGRRSPARK